MIENLNVTYGRVTWKNNDKNVILEIEDAFFATENVESKTINIDSGKNFMATKVYCYSYDGNMELFYDLEQNIVEWIYHGVRKRLVINYLKQVLYFPQKQRIFILSDSDVQELFGYTLMGDCLFKVNSPTGFKTLYFTWAKDKISIVCEGDICNEDQYGRSRYNFLLDINSGILTRGSLAY